MDNNEELEEYKDPLEGLSNEKRLARLAEQQYNADKEHYDNMFKNENTSVPKVKNDGTPFKDKFMNFWRSKLGNAERANALADKQSFNPTLPPETVKDVVTKKIPETAKNMFSKKATDVTPKVTEDKTESVPTQEVQESSTVNNPDLSYGRKGVQNNLVGGAIQNPQEVSESVSSPDVNENVVQTPQENVVNTEETVNNPDLSFGRKGVQNNLVGGGVTQEQLDEDAKKIAKENKRKALEEKNAFFETTPLKESIEKKTEGVKDWLKEAQQEEVDLANKGTPDPAYYAPYAPTDAQAKQLFAETSQNVPYTGKQVRERAGQATEDIASTKVPKPSPVTLAQIWNDPDLTKSQKAYYIRNALFSGLARLGGDYGAVSDIRRRNLAMEDQYNQNLARVAREQVDTPIDAIKSSLQSDLTRLQSPYDTLQQAFNDRFATLSNEETFRKLSDLAINNSQEFFKSFYALDEKGNPMWDDNNKKWIIDLGKMNAFIGYTQAKTGGMSPMDAFIYKFGDDLGRKVGRFFFGEDPTTIKKPSNDPNLSSLDAEYEDIGSDPSKISTPGNNPILRLGGDITDYEITKFNPQVLKIDFFGLKVNPESSLDELKNTRYSVALRAEQKNKGEEKLADEILPLLDNAIGEKIAENQKLVRGILDSNESYDYKVRQIDNLKKSRYNDFNIDIGNNMLDSASSILKSNQSVQSVFMPMLNDYFNSNPIIKQLFTSPNTKKFGNTSYTDFTGQELGSTKPYVEAAKNAMKEMLDKAINSAKEDGADLSFVNAQYKPLIDYVNHLDEVLKGGTKTETTPAKTTTKKTKTKGKK